ncbi:MAG TPA: hypothetical protein VGR71_15300, partial [Nitrospira sp.]|nr:hypothetical protein [Nitrospira sp.]
TKALKIARSMWREISSTVKAYALHAVSNSKTTPTPVHHVDWSSVPSQIVVQHPKNFLPTRERSVRRVRFRVIRERAAVPGAEDR